MREMWLMMLWVMLLVLLLLCCCTEYGESYYAMEYYYHYHHRINLIHRSCSTLQSKKSDRSIQSLISSSSSAAATESSSNIRMSMTRPSKAAMQLNAMNRMHMLSSMRGGRMFYSRENHNHHHNQHKDYKVIHLFQNIPARTMIVAAANNLGVAVDHLHNNIKEYNYFNKVGWLRDFKDLSRKLKLFELPRLVNEGIVQDWKQTWTRLQSTFGGSLSSDSVLLLYSISIIKAFSNVLQTTGMLGLMGIGTLFGPHGIGLLKNVHVVEQLGELGLVLCIFEMALHVSSTSLFANRYQMVKFGVLYALAVTSVAVFCLTRIVSLSVRPALILGLAFTLSSSAITLPLLEKLSSFANDQVNSTSNHDTTCPALVLRTGESQAISHKSLDVSIDMVPDVITELNHEQSIAKELHESSWEHLTHSFLLLHDLCLVPTLLLIAALSKDLPDSVIVPLPAFIYSSFKAVFNVLGVSVVLRSMMIPLLSFAGWSRSREAVTSATLGLLVAISFLANGVGLSDAMGALLAGRVLSKSIYKSDIIRDLLPIRDALLAMFYISVGIHLSPKFVYANLFRILATVGAIFAGKLVSICAMGWVVGLPINISSKMAVITSHVGEVAIIAAGLAERSGMIDKFAKKLIITASALSMGLMAVLAYFLKSSLSATAPKGIENAHNAANKSFH